jgi:pimeloyl-ACP methyl ester carboxylesterase
VTGLLVLHGLGDAEGGTPWTETLASVGLPVQAPDLPGHGLARPPVDGTYTTGTILIAAARVLEGVEPPGPVVLGVGASGWVALMLGVAGRASAVAVVDGLGGPWRNGTEAVAESVEWARRLMDDPLLARPVPAGEMDPRLAHPAPSFSNQRTVGQAIAALAVPLLVMSSPRDRLDEGERRLVLGANGGATPRTSVAVGSARPEDVRDPLQRWILSLGLAAEASEIPSS